MHLLIPALIIGAIGLLIGVLLAVAAIVFRVEVDPKVPQITECLPGANCGGCGFSGCGAYAAAVADGAAAPNCCSVGGAAVAEKIGEIMGIQTEFIPKRAVVLCEGDCEVAAQKYEYQGLADCTMAAKLAQGPKACNFGCMGLGSCVKACKFGAIAVEKGIAKVNPALCTGCGACANVCPKAIIAMVPKETHIVVRCKSNDKGGAMKSLCSAGCIGCKICEKNCPAEAIRVIENHALIDYDACTSCGLCIEKCPKKIIRQD